MVILSNEELKKIQRHELMMCENFVKVCKTLNLTYYLMGGSMLGAVRHSGYIPWDDDLDVGMPRQDYEIFLEKGQSLFPQNYFIQTHLSDPEYPYNFAKLRDTDTAFVESAVKNFNINHGVFIDIFPLDIYPDNKIQQRILEFIKKLTEVRVRETLYFEISPQYSIVSKIAIALAKVVYPDYKSAVVAREKAIKAYKKGKKLANHGGAWKGREIVPSEWYGEGVMVDFEGIKVRIPSHSDRWLEQVYGDYMQMPPEEKRVAHHYTEVVDLRHSYKIYKGEY